MKKVIFFAALGVVFGAAMAFGQNSLKFKADIPFDFHVGGIHMPADQYEIVAGYTPLGGMMFRMRAHDLSTIALIPSRAAATKATDRPKLVFRRYGDEYFLAEVHQESGIAEDLTISSGKHEDEAHLAWTKKQANANVEPIKVVLTLSR
jgi:hypothetical protein